MTFRPLYNYQREGIKKGKENLKKRGFTYLGWEPGLGKSRAILQIGFESRLLDNVLIVAPAFLTYNWKNEVSKWMDAPCSILTQPDDLLFREAISVCSYDFVRTHIKDITDSMGKISLLILDEAHYVNNKGALRTQAIWGKLAHKARKIACLSGTPTVNGPWEMYPVFAITGFISSSYAAWMDWFITDELGKPINIAGDYFHKFKNIYKTVVHTYKKQDVLKDLPPIQFVPHYVKSLIKIPPDFEIPENIDEIPEIPEELQSLYRDLGERKVPEVLELIAAWSSECIRPHRLVIFAYNHSVIDALHSRIGKYYPPDAKIHKITGQVSHENRNMIVQEFQSETNYHQVIVGQMHAMGVGINLTSCNDVIFVQHPWTPATYNQCVSRCHRIGTKKGLKVIDIIAQNTLDSSVIGTIQRKAQLIGMYDN